MFLGHHVPYINYSRIRWLASYFRVTMAQIALIMFLLATGFAY